MSGITPILDTLLHQVLGRRRATPPRPLRTPVPRTPPGQAPRGAHSDSRLDARAARASASSSERAADGVRGARDNANGKSLPADLRAPASIARLSRTGRLIADIQARASGRPGVLRPQMPLLEKSDRPPPAALARALRQSIEASGLFYEAHLRRWQQGGFPLSRLAREPQMIWLRAAVKTAHDDQASEVPRHLESIVHQQLDMLATPIVRWEGQAWAGMAMALILIPPRPPQEGDAGEPHRRGHRGEEEPAWQTRLTLHGRHLGEVGVDVRLTPTRIGIDVQAGASAAAHLQAGAASLRKRLAPLAPAEVSVRVRTRMRE